MMMKKARRDSDIDMILQLPENIVHGILSSLPFKEAVRTSVLSKRWQYTWIAGSKKLPFSYGFFKLDSSGKSEEEINAKREQSLDLMEATLRRRCCMQRMATSLEELRMEVRFINSKVVTSLDRCISYATGCNVSSLILGTHCSVNYDGENEFYNLPRTVFAAKSLRDLSLYGWKLEYYSLCTNINLCCLTKMNIGSVFVDDQIIQNLIANCPVIEKLSLLCCYGSKDSLNISGLVNPKLAAVDVSDCDFARVEIEEALGLTSFNFDGERCGLWREQWRNCDISVSTCKNMTKLWLKNVSITDELLHDNLSNLCLLEELVISGCDTVETIKISSGCLKLLKVIGCRNMAKVEIDDPSNLRKFDYFGWNAISFSSKALALEEANISLYPDDDDDDGDGDLDAPWFGKLIEFLGKFNNSKVLNLRSHRYKSFSVPEELRESLHPPLSNVKHFTLFGQQRSLAMKEIVAALLWLSPHPVTIRIDQHIPEKHLDLTFLYKENENPCCCSSLPIRRHCIKEVKIDSFDWTQEDVMSLKSCFNHTNLRWRWERQDLMIGHI